MTPDEARRLLDNFDRLLPFEAELEIEGAAKDMAAMIAGMREEWAREARIMGSSGWFNLGWCRSRAEAELTDWTRSLPLGAMVEYRLVRRYVTTPEEA